MTKIIMKTPLQEILQFEYYSRQMFDSDERVAMALLDYIRVNKEDLLEKEKEVIKDAWMDGGFPLDNWLKQCAEAYYNETFNTKEE